MVNSCSLFQAKIYPFLVDMDRNYTAYFIKRSIIDIVTYKMFCLITNINDVYRSVNVVSVMGANLSDH